MLAGAAEAGAKVARVPDIKIEPEPALPLTMNK
jgi:hypothetical protein